MASMFTKIKKASSKKKAYLLVIISFFSLAVFLGVNIVLAYYHTEAPLSILAGSIGDFSIGEGDINMILFKETDVGSNVFVRSYSVPAVGYKFNDELTHCSKPCDSDATKSCQVICDTYSEGTASCYYIYDVDYKKFTLTSDHKITCKFYFNALSSSDINVHILVEDENGEEAYKGSDTTNTKTYSYIENIPVYGYVYKDYYCEKAVKSVTYNSETRKFVVSTTTKNTCYAYFDKNGSADVTVNVYVQSDDDGTVYELVNSIPDNRVYKLSTSKTNKCYNSSGDLSTTIEYTDGYINIAADAPQECDVYLDLDTSS